MTEDEILLSHARDLKNRAAENAVTTATAFLDLRQRALLKCLEKENREYVRTVYYGGYREAERVCAVFIPSFYEVTEDLQSFFCENEIDSPVQLLRFNKDKFTSLSHRDYLGALMGLGLKRETVGDILCDEEGAYIILTDKAAQFVKENMNTVGRASVRISDAPFDEISGKEENFEERHACIASLRLDNFVSAAFSLSRTKSAEFIQKGVVFVNSAQVLKPDSKVSQGDKITFRGKGKVVFALCGAESKKGRLHITIKKYL